MTSPIPAICNSQLERLQLALSSVGIGTWDWEPRAGNMTWDEQMYALFGVPADGFDGRHESFLNLISPDDRERIAAEISDALAKGVEFDGEFRVLRPADQNIHFLRMRFKVPGAGQEVQGVVTGVCWDVTERRLAQERLATKGNLLNTLMDYLPDHIYFKDRQSRFIAVNKAKARRNGLADPAELIGKTDFDFFSAEHANAAYGDEGKVIETGEPIIGFVEKETWPDGRVTWVSSTKVPLRDENGRIIGTFGLSRDVTERKLAEENLAKIAEELRIKNEALEEDLEMARELQGALLPQQYPRFPHSASAGETAVRFCHFFDPSMAVGGDFFDVLDISDTMAGVFVCDVMGHGVRAALVAAIVRAIVSDLKMVWSNPGEFLAQLNQALRVTLKDARVPIFASAFYGVVDATRGELRYGNAGHPWPLIIGQGDSRSTPQPINDSKPGPALGLFDDLRYTISRRPLSPHDVMLVFTDGLFEVEGADGQLYDYEQLLQVVSRHRDLAPAALCRDIVSEIKQFSASHEFTDDVCLLAVELDHLVREETEPVDG
ncbi:MAG: phosphoserine phosphatase RsbU/P [Chthoniobacter sp.]|jgi:sigma-B regulation protein RsbU (phosphoserine phosphatase)|nr:phosphoserine phosphatase RsbU/P [Chthoniobacter sp.]